MEKKDIEIPFGAFDSELGGFEYTIPEGYEAEIKDGKVVVRKTESEDERVRKEIIRIVDIWTNSAPVVNGIPREVLLAWLEKQGEQKPKFRVGDTIKCKYDDRQFTIESIDLEKRVYIYTEKGCGNDIDYTDEEFELVEQNPAWSEEDEIMFRKAIITIDNVRMNTDSQEYYQGICDWLKSLRPQNHWKPSDEQMEALRRMKAAIAGEGEIYKPLNSLYEDLKKLREE